MSNNQSGESGTLSAVALGPFAVTALVYVATVRADLLGHPWPGTAEAGLPSLLLAHLSAYIVTVVASYVTLIPYSRLNRSIYAPAGSRSIREWLALASVVVSQGLAIVIQHSTYAEMLRTFALFRTPNWAVGVTLAIPVWYIARMKTVSVLRMTQAFFYLQILVLPILFLPLGEWSVSNLVGLLGRPSLAVLPALPPVLHLYFGAPALLLLDDKASVTVARRLIPAALALVALLLVLITVFVPGVLGRELLAIEAYPGMKYFQTTRIPNVERIDLVILFAFANVAISASAVLGHGIALALGAVGLGKEAGAVAVAILVAASTFLPVIPGGSQRYFVASAIALVVSNVFLLTIPKARTHG